VEWIQVLFISTNPARFGDIGIGNLAIGITLMKSLAIFELRFKSGYGLINMKIIYVQDAEAKQSN
jgi:hypothetical protein